jgi:hypothetical protein
MRTSVALQLDTAAESFGANLVAALPDVVAQAIGGALGGGIRNRIDRANARAAQGGAQSGGTSAAEQANATTAPVIQQPSAQVTAQPVEAASGTNTLAEGLGRQITGSSVEAMTSSIAQTSTPTVGEGGGQYDGPEIVVTATLVDATDPKPLGQRDRVSTYSYLLWASKLSGQDRLDELTIFGARAYGKNIDGDTRARSISQQVKNGIYYGNEAFNGNKIGGPPEKLIMSFLRDGEAILPEYTAGFRAAAEQYQALHDGIDAKVSAQLRRDAIDLGIIYAKEAAMLATGEIGGRIIGKAAEVAAPYVAKVASKIAAKASGAAERAGGIRTAQGIKFNGITGPGPLSPDVAVTFRSSTYTEIVTTDSTMLYRAYGGKASPLSQYWTRTAPTGPYQATIDSALLPQWGNTARQVSTIRVPAGTTIYDGAAAAQGGLVGGGSQVVIPRVNPNWVVPK